MTQFDYYWSDRLPITLGRGGVLVHPHVKGLTENGFIDNETLMLFEQGNLVELETIIEQLLEDKDKREALRATAMATIRQNHTWQHRLKYVERVINES